MKLFYACILTLVSMTSYAQEWVPLSQSGDISYEILAGSIRVIKAEKDSVVVGTGRVVTLTDNTITAELWAVPIAHCRVKRGVLVVLDVLGEVKSRHSFVYGLGTVAADVAEIMCRVALDAQTSKPPKVNV